MTYPLIRPLLFGLEPERAHDMAISGLARAQRSAALRRRLARRFARHDARLGQRLLGFDLAAPVAVAAGFDKDARLVPMLAALGFGAVEVGTVTPLAQPGNPPPRLWRHPRHRSLQNCLGFNSGGAEVVAAHLTALGERPVPVGVNLGKNRATPLADAADDYLSLVDRFAELADYFVLNLSSPNTRGLRDLQVPDFVGRVVTAARRRTAVPVLVKIAPDLDDRVAVELARAAMAAGARGVIATNTTTDYRLIPGAREVGGLSGEVLRERSFELLQELAAALDGGAVLVSVGGVDSAAEAYRRLRAGAAMVQLYTAMVYRGPGIAAIIHRGLLRRLERDGFDRLEQVIGIDR